MKKQAQEILLAEFFFAGRPPQVGETLNIEFFKEKPGHPNVVRILDITEQFDVDEGLLAQRLVFTITAEPA